MRMRFIVFFIFLKHFKHKMTLELKKFDMRHISFKPDENKGPVVVLIGRRDTGK